MLHGQTAHKKSFFFASGRGSAMILGVSARSRTFPGGLFGVPSRLRGLSGRSWNVPGRPKSLLSHARKRKKTTFCTQSVHEASLDQFFVNFGGFSICRQSLRTLESTAPASKNKGSALCAESRVAHALQPRKSYQIGPKTSNFATF